MNLSRHGILAASKAVHVSECGLWLIFGTNFALKSYAYKQHTKIFEVEIVTLHFVVKGFSLRRIYESSDVSDARGAMAQFLCSYRRFIFQPSGHRR